MQRPTNRRKLVCEDDQLLERIKREVGDLADLDARQAEALQQSEKFYRTIFDQSPVGLYIYDKEFKITHCNERMFQILGAFYERIVGLDTKKINDLSFMSAMKKALEGEFCHEEHFYEANNSSTGLWLSLSISPLHNTSGNVIGGISVVEDVMERKRVEQKLRESEEQYCRLVENTSALICEIGINGQFLYISPNLRDVLGYEPEELVGRNLFELAHPDDCSNAIAELGCKIKPHSSGQAVLRYRHKNGQWRWLEIMNKPFRTAAGELRGVITCQDITERHITGEQIREQAALLDKAQDAIIAGDLEHRIIFWNKGAENLYGWTKKEAIGEKANELLYKGGSFQFIESYRSVIEKGEWMGELHQINKKGEAIIVESRWTTVRDSEGNPKSILTINTDATEKKKLEAQFLRAQRMESVGALASGIAHDLNNILSPIMMALQLLRKKLTDQNSQGLLNTLETSAQRGADLIRQVLSFARGPEGSHTVIQLRYIISEIEKVLREIFPKSIEIRTDIPKDLWAISGDPTQLHQVFMNLCVNARDAISNSGKLSISAHNLFVDEDCALTNIDVDFGPYVVVTVSDTGAGISPEIVDRIFEPFFTTKEPGKGTGLGLSASFGIVKGHGGFIKVNSDVGKGTRFEVYLPAIETNDIRKLEAKDPEPPSGRGELILVVDDEGSLREVMRTILERNGYRVMTAVDGAEAIASYVQREAEIKAVIMDMVMPIMDGPAGIKALHRINPKVKIIAASGLMERDKIAEITDIEVESFLSKPYKAYNLLTTLYKVINGGDEVGGG